nr:glycosyltransferase family 39 protein [Chloroflexia bacterium]
TLSALFGTLAVLFTWLLCHRLFDRRTALLAASILAVFHFHVHMSRLALNNVADSFFLMAMLFFLDRGFSERRRLDCLLAGMCIGISQYFYTSARLIPLVAMMVALSFAATLLLGREPTATSRIPMLGRWAGFLCWMVTGAALAYLPLLAYYVDHPETFSSRIKMVSIFASGWLEERQRNTGQSAVVLVARNLWHTALVPFHVYPTGTYRGDPPFVGLPMAIPLGLGLALLTARAWQRRCVGLAVAYWGATFAIALTIAPDTNRFTIVAPIFAVACGLTLDALARIATELLGLGRRLVHAGLAVALVLLIGWSVTYYFQEHEQLALYGDRNTLVANDLARHLENLPPGTTVYFSGPPRMWYDGFPNLAFIARETRGITVERPWDERSLVPKLDGPTVFVFLPERVGELDRVRSWFPNGETRELSFDNGEPLFTVYRVDP